MLRCLLAASVVLPFAVAPAPARPAAIQSDLPLSAERVAVGSPDRTAVGVAQSNGALRMSGAAFSAEVSVGGIPVGLGTSGSSFSARGSTLLASGAGLGQRPLLATVEPRLLDAAGGEAVRLHGLGLDGGGAPSVWIGGQVATVVASSSTELTVLTPPLRNGFGNPLGPVVVTVDSGPSTSTGGALALAGPTYSQTRLARLGATFDLTHTGAPFAFGFPAWATEIPGVVLPFPGIQGSLELANLLLLLPASPLDAQGIGIDTFAVPDKPSLVGLSLSFQSVVFESLAPPIASFTNVTTATILP